MQTVKIQSVDNTIATRVFIGDNHIEGVTNVSFEQSAGELPVFTFETHNYPNIEIDNPDIRFRFTTETITDSVKVLRHSIITDKVLYDAFVASIESATKELPPHIDRECAARRIADRIIGREE